MGNFLVLDNLGVLVRNFEKKKNLSGTKILCARSLKLFLLKNYLGGGLKAKRRG